MRRAATTPLAHYPIERRFMRCSVRFEGLDPNRVAVAIALGLLCAGPVTAFAAQPPAGAMTRGGPSNASATQSGRRQDTEVLLHSFTGGSGDGAVPIFGSLVGDASGNLYGTTNEGGVKGAGTVYRLSPPAPGQTAWTETILHSFAGGRNDGAAPEAGLALDASGALYGTTAAGGRQTSACFSNNFFAGCGTVFKLTPPAPGSSQWTESIVYAFRGPNGDGFDPVSTPIVDAGGALYGTTESGGASGCGVAFRLAPPKRGQTTWTETVLHAFCSYASDGNAPRSGLVAGADGALYGVTLYGGDRCGQYGCGAVYKLTPPPLGTTGWSESVLHSFSITTDGATPESTPIIDAHGNLYGTTAEGGLMPCPYDSYAVCGTVYELAPPAPGRTTWKLTTLHEFSGLNGDGVTPIGSLVADAGGALYGTTVVGGAANCFGIPADPKRNCGAAFKLTPPVPGQTTWTESILHVFNSYVVTGGTIYGGLVFDGAGNLYGTSYYGGSGTHCVHGCGTVFELEH
jgi:uncharacterized repeat protein (TIGR03803 family)